MNNIYIKLKLKLKSWLMELLGVPEMNAKIELLYRSLNIGIDSHYTKENWAVICIKGNPCYLNLINLGAQDILELRAFIKHYESKGARNFFIDHPSGFQL